MQDKFGRIIDTIRISVTDKCNLRCYYCIPDDYTFKDTKILTFEEIVQIVKESVEIGITRIKLTGGEPLLRKNIVNLISEISKIESITDLSITTNGTLLKNLALPLKLAGLKRINVSLDALDEKLYSTITGGGSVFDVIEGIKEAKKVNLVPIKINTVLLNGKNEEEIPKIKEFCKNNDFDFQLINEMKLTKEKKDSENFYNTQKPPKCDKCNRIRLTSDGKLLPCLFGEKEIDIKQFNSIKEALISCIDNKIKKGKQNESRVMNEIGG